MDKEIVKVRNRWIVKDEKGTHKFNSPEEAQIYVGLKEEARQFESAEEQRFTGSTDSSEEPEDPYA